MKRLLTLLLSYAFILSIWGQGYTVTIHDGETLVGVYSGEDAFRNAYNASSSGQTITLSEGNYKTLDGPIKKSLTIIGNSAFIVGYGSYTEVESTHIENLSIEADDVRIEGLYVSNEVILGGVKDLMIKHCYFKTLSANHQHERTTIDQSVIINNNSLEKSQNLVVTNSTIDTMDGNSESNMVEFINCVIYTWYPHMHFGNYQNCVLGYYGRGTIDTQAPSKYYNTVFTSLYQFDENASYSNSALTTAPSLGSNSSCNYNCYTRSFTSLFGLFKRLPATSLDVPNGSDGTPIGPDGGTGFSIYPNVPRGVGYIDIQLGANNTIHVNITAVSYNPKATKIAKYKYWWNNQINSIKEGDVPYINGNYVMNTDLKIPNEVLFEHDYAYEKCNLNILFYDDAGMCSPVISSIFSDKEAPTVTMDKLPEEVNEGKLLITWSGVDDWSGVKDYTLEAYIERGVYSYSTTHTTTDNKFLYESLEDNYIGFSLVARDLAGNESEKTPIQYVRFKYIDTVPPVTTFTVNNSSKGPVTASATDGATIQYNAVDNHDGVKSYNVYYAEHDGPFILWKPDTKTDTSIFYGIPGMSYRIIVTSTDNNNNAEEINPEQAITVVFN